MPHYNDLVPNYTKLYEYQDYKYDLENPRYYYHYYYYYYYYYYSLNIA